MFKWLGMFKWLAEPQLNAAVDTVNKVIQILALVVAGWWAYRTFYVSVAPGLEFRGSIDPEIVWSKSSDDGYCTGSLNIILTNEGVSSFDISSLTIKGWLYTSEKATANSQQVEIPKPVPDDPVRIEVGTIAAGPAFYEQTFRGDDFERDLVGHYPPGTKNSTSVLFHFNKSKGQGVLFVVTTKTSDKTSQFVPNGWTTDDVCALPEPGADKKTK